MEKYDFLMPLAVMGGAAIFWYVVIKYITDYLLKRKMVDKGYVTEESQALFKQQQNEDNKYSSLKWGLIIFFGGLALILLEYIPYSPDSPLPFGVFALSIAIGFLTYFFVIKKEAEKKQ